MDGFALLMVGGVGAILLVLWLIGRATPGNGTESAGLRSAREIEETRTALEIEDDAQVHEALANLRARRAAREAGEEA